MYTRSAGAMKRLFHTGALIVACTVLGHAQGPWNLPDLQKAPRMTEVPTQEPGVRALFFDSVPWRGKPTRVFAYYSAPQGKKLPAIVLIHGGGGTAFAEWVRQWNRRGYAAIAIDTCGAKPELVSAGDPWKPARHRHSDGGPDGWGGFDQIDQPITDQWTYHAVSAAILAHSLIRSFPEVDARRIGVTGISWGGYLTAILSGIDQRLRFAIPVYGCGFLGEDSGWLETFRKLGPEKSARWLRLWDPSVYLPASRIPMLWVSGANELSYPIGSLQKSYRLPTGPHTLTLRVNMQHGHRQGAEPREIVAFADSIVRGGKPLPTIVEATGDKVRYRSKRRITKAELNYTEGAGPWGSRKWTAVPAKLDTKRQVAIAEVPRTSTAWYFNLSDEQQLLVSSPHQTRLPE